MRAAGLEPLVPYPGAQPKWLCRCVECGTEVTPRYYNIKNGWGGCRICKGARQSVAQLIPEVSAVASMRRSGIEPLEPYPGRQKPWQCRCQSCNRQISPRLDGVLRGQGGCKWCAPNAPVGPEAAAELMRAAGLHLLEPYPGAATAWKCRCTTCGADVSPSYNNVRMGHGGCRGCRHRETAGQSQRIAEDVAESFMLDHGFQPLEPYRNSHSPWPCRCLTCGSEVAPTYSNIRNGSGGCRFCCPRGFNSDVPAVVYLVAHKRLRAAKVGIGRAAGNRVEQHRKLGWYVLTCEPVPGKRALAIEENILGWWRTELALPAYLSKGEMPQGGWTETVDLDEVDIAATIERIRALAAVTGEPVSA